MSTPTEARWEAMSVGDELVTLNYTMTQDVVDEYRRVTEDSTPNVEPDMAHPLLTATDYIHLVNRKYGHVGSGLHVSQESYFYRPMRVGMKIETTGKMIDLYQKNDRDYWVISYESRDQEGTLLVRHVMGSTIDRPDQEQPQPAAQTPSASTSSPAAPSRPSDNLDWQAVFSREFTLEKQIDFGRTYVSRHAMPYKPERNAHSDQEFAREIGLPDAVGHSNHYYAWFGEAALAHFGPDWRERGWLKGKFIRPVFPGDVIEIQQAETTGEDGSAELRLKAVNQHGVVISAGSAGLGFSENEK